MGRGFIRVAVVVAVLAAVLVPAWSAPARTLSFPATLTKSVDLGKKGTIRFEFPPTHIAFSWVGDHSAGVRYRTHLPDGTLSRWRAAREAVDYHNGNQHFGALAAVDHPIAVDFSRVVPAGNEMESLRLDYLNTLDGPRRTETVAAVAEAGPDDPKIVTRAQWGADESIKKTSGRCRRQFFPVQQLFVHHTAGVNFDSHPAATMRAIYWYHVVRQNWCDIGYNFVIAPDGRIFEGRWARRYAPFEIHSSESTNGYAVAGAHVAGYNSGSIGISLMGNFSQVSAPPPMRRSLAEMLAWEADRHDLPPLGRHTYVNPETKLKRSLPYIAGHRDAGQTECPGNLVYAALPDIRRDTASVIGSGKANSVLTLTADPGVTSAETVTFVARLTDQSGAGLAARQLTIYRKDSSGDWGPVARPVTGADGTATYSSSVTRSTRVRAVYDGDRSTWGAQSPDVKLGGAKVALTAEGGTPDVAGIVYYPLGTKTVTLSGRVAPWNRRGVVRVAVARSDGEGSSPVVLTQDATPDDSGAYRVTFELPDPSSGTYRAGASLLLGARVAATSRPLTFVVG